MGVNSKYYENTFSKFYQSDWKHENQLCANDLLLTGYPFSVELPLSKGAKWLELGVGSGRVVDFHEARHSEVDVVGVDQSEAALEKLRRCVSANIKLQKADIRELNYPEASFDIITLFGTIQALEKEAWIPTVKRLSKFLKPNGSIGFSVHPMSCLEVLRSVRKLGNLKYSVTRSFLEKELKRADLFESATIEKHHVFVLLIKIGKLLGLPVAHWYGFEELKRTPVTEKLTRFATRYLPFLTFGHYWVWVKKAS